MTEHLSRSFAHASLTGQLRLHSHDHIKLKLEDSGVPFELGKIGEVHDFGIGQSDVMAWSQSGMHLPYPQSTIFLTISSQQGPLECGIFFTKHKDLVDVEFALHLVEHTSYWQLLGAQYTLTDNNINIGPSVHFANMLKHIYASTYELYLEQYKSDYAKVREVTTALAMFSVGIFHRINNRLIDFVIPAVSFADTRENARRKQRKLPPLLRPRVIDIDKVRQLCSGVSTTDHTSTGRLMPPHDRSGHYGMRHGKRVWIRACKIHGGSTQSPIYEVISNAMDL